MGKYIFLKFIESKFILNTYIIKKNNINIFVNLITKTKLESKIKKINIFFDISFL